MDVSETPTESTPLTQLAIESTGRGGSLAVLEGKQVLLKRAISGPARTAAVLAVELSDALHWCASGQHPIHFLSVAEGPGSFTGLRIAVTTAKTLSYALGLPLATVGSLEAIAATAFWEHAEIDELLVAINAYRGQVFAGRFRRSQVFPLHSADDRPLADPSGHVRRTAEVIDRPQWRDLIEGLTAGTPVTGDAGVFGNTPVVRFLERQTPDAVGVGLVAAGHASLGRWTDPIGLVPKYLRPSAAEEGL